MTAFPVRVTATEGWIGSFELMLTCVLRGPLEVGDQVSGIVTDAPGVRVAGVLKVVVTGTPPGMLILLMTRSAVPLF